MHREASNRERLARWVQEHARAVHGYVFALVRDVHLADDVVQDVFCRAWEARNRYEDRGCERAYLLKIADRLACDAARRRGRWITVDDETWSEREPAGDDPAPAQQLMNVENEQALFAALNELSELQRRTLLLRYYGNMDFREIARVLECPANTVLSHAHRGLAKLRTILEKAR